MSAIRLPWVVAGTVALGCSATFLMADHGARLQWTPSSAWWTRYSSQFVHWTARMALFDLGALLIAGVWVETRSRAVAGVTLLAGLVGAGAVVPWCGLAVYRGSSGLATAMVTVLLIQLAGRDSPPSTRRLAWLFAALIVAKLAWERSSGAAVAAGPLPPGVVVAWQVHLAGVLAAIWSRGVDPAGRDRSPSGHAPGGGR